MLELFMFLMLELLKVIWNVYSLGLTFLLKFVMSIFWQVFFVAFFFWNFIIFSIFFPTRVAKLKKFETKKYVGCGGVIQLFKPTISPN